MQKKVQAPAVALLVVAGLTVLVFLLSLVANTWVVRFAEQADMPAEQLARIRELSQVTLLSVVVGLVLNVGGAALIAFGAWQMLKLRSWGFALAASILAMIPCFTSCCCLLGLPAGIWALVVLLDPDVKAAFAAAQQPPPLP
jgi:hypothetical protein